MGFCTKMK